MIIPKENEIELNFDYVFVDNQPVYFAWTYPWSYAENQ